MKKTQLKALLKIIVQEAIAAKQERLAEAKGLSGYKKSPESTEHTENVADSKDLTGGAPKEKKEGKKLPVVKKPATPQKVGSLKEEIVEMIREAISEMARTAGAVDPQYRKEIEPGKWVIMGHPNQQKYPDGSPTTAPKGKYVPKGENPNLGRPTKASADGGADVGGEEGDDTDDDEAAPEATGGGFNSKIEVVIDGDTIGELDLAKIKGSVAGYLGSMLRANNVILKLDPSVNAKLDEFSDLFVDDKLPTGSTLNLALGSNSVKLV